LKLFHEKINSLRTYCLKLLLKEQNVGDNVGDDSAHSNLGVESPQAAGDAVDDPAQNVNCLRQVVNWKKRKIT
jgi:hypothetical protein